MKDFPIQSGGLESIEVTAHMIDTCKRSSYSLYKKYLQDKKQEESRKKEIKKRKLLLEEKVF